MRILHTVEFYAPHPGGAELVVQRLSEGLVRRGHEVVVATSWDERRSDLMHNGVRIEPFRASGNAARGLKGEFHRYQEWLARETFDVVMNYAAQSWPTDAALPLLRRLPAARVLATCGFSGLQWPRSLLYLGYYRRLRRDLSAYDALVYHADDGADVRFGKTYGPARQVTIPNGCDGRIFTEAPDGFRARHGIHSAFLVLHVGNHYRVKGHPALYRVMDRLRDLDATLVVVGEDPGGLRSCWQACVRSAGRHGGVRLLRGLPRAEVLAVYREADLLLVTSRFEVASLVLIEAMAAGVPFVTFDVGNARELDGGVVVRGAEEMAAAARRLLVDAAERRRLGQAGRAHQRRSMEWDIIVEQYERLYVSLLDRRTRAGGAGG